MPAIKSKTWKLNEMMEHAVAEMDKDSGKVALVNQIGREHSYSVNSISMDTLNFESVCLCHLLKFILPLFHSSNRQLFFLHVLVY